MLVVLKLFELALYATISLVQAHVLVIRRAIHSKSLDLYFA